MHRCCNECTEMTCRLLNDHDSGKQFQFLYLRETGNPRKCVTIMQSGSRIDLEPHLCFGIGLVSSKAPTRDASDYMNLGQK
jgi:hypothetical protein